MSLLSMGLVAVLCSVAGASVVLDVGVSSPATGVPISPDLLGLDLEFTRHVCM